MPARYLSTDFSLDRLQEELVYSYAKLQAHPATQAIAPGAKSLLDEWQVLVVQEVGLRTEKVRAIAQEELADEELNDTVDEVVYHISGLDPGKREPLVRLLLNGVPPSVFKRPVLGRQLEQMRAWPAALQMDTIPASLRALSPRVEAQVSAADQVSGAKEEANQSLRQFRLVGERFQFIQKLNRWRQETFGELDKLAAKDEKLPRNFAARFFLNNSQAEPTLTTEEELVQLAARIEEAQSTAAALEFRRQALWNEKAKQDAALEEERSLQSALEETQRKAAELRARLRKR